MVRRPAEVTHPFDPIIVRLLRRRKAGSLLRRYGVVRFRRRLFWHLRVGEQTFIEIEQREEPDVSDVMYEVLATALY